MIKVTITDAYAGSGPELEKYETFIGEGSHKRSVKKAVSQAKEALSRAIRNGGEWAGSGTPILWEMTIVINGKRHYTYDNREWKTTKPAKLRGCMVYTSPRYSQLKAKFEARRLAAS